MKDSVETAARDVEQSVQQSGAEFEKSWAEATEGLTSDSSTLASDARLDSALPEYRHPGKKWRLKRGATPQWYKAHAGVRRQVQSGAARVARFRPHRPQ